MENTSQRNNRRFKVAIHAAVSDRQKRNSIRCMIHNGSISGCKIVSSQIASLPNDALIKVTNLNQHIKGCIAWRDHNSAGVEFKWKTAHPDERRKATRQEMVLPAIIMDYSLNKLADCIIGDASRSGCRIVSEDISKIPDDVLIQIPGLTDPILSLVIWRKGNMAGLEFFWESEIYILDNTLAV